MARTRWRPARKALISTVGMGKRPLVASAVAAIRPRVAAGTSIPPMSRPITGSWATAITAAMYRKNSPANASGCLANVCMPSLTHLVPVRAGTMLSFTSKSECHGLRRPLAHHPLEVRWVAWLQHCRLAREVEIPQARDPEAQRAGALHRRQQLPFGRGQRPHAGIGLQERRRARRVVGTGGEVDAPVVQADGDVEQPAVDPGEIEIEEA